MRVDDLYCHDASSFAVGVRQRGLPDAFEKPAARRIV